MSLACVVIDILAQLDSLIFCIVIITSETRLSFVHIHVISSPGTDATSEAPMTSWTVHRRQVFAVRVSSFSVPSFYRLQSSLFFEQSVYTGVVCR